MISGSRIARINSLVYGARRCNNFLPGIKIAPIPKLFLCSRNYSENSDKKPTPPTQNRIGLLASVGLGASLLMTKTKYVLVALKLTKAAPLASMVLSSFAYSFIFGWPYAVGMVGLIFFHECGHAIVLHRYGVPFSPMVFIPFMGAVIVTKDKPRSCYEEALIAIGGPAMGTVAAMGCGVGGTMMDSQLLFALADFGFMINLFNLLPIGSMDGGRIASAISPWLGVAGLAGGGWLIYSNPFINPLFYLIMLSGGYDTATRFFSHASEETTAYRSIPRARQAQLAAAYAGLVAALLLAMSENNKRRRTPRQLEQGGGGGGDGGFGDQGNPHDGLYDDYFGKSF